MQINLSLQNSIMSIKEAGVWLLWKWTKDEQLDRK